MTEEILIVVFCPAVGEIQRANAEKFAGALAVTCGNNRGINPDEPICREIVVDGLGNSVAYSGDRSKSVGSWP